MRVLSAGAREAIWRFGGIARSPFRDLDSATAMSTKSGLEGDIARLSALLSQGTPAKEADVAELLRGIETADGMAQGVEAKLDEMLNNLDQLLASLESESTTTEAQPEVSK